MSEHVNSISSSVILPNFHDIKDENEIQYRFIQSARSIMLEHALVRGEYRWQITALELYLFHERLWRDPNTDKSPEQLEREKWYIRIGRNDTRWRIDITAGSDGIHAGLLIAAIGVEDGSGIALNTILRGASPKRTWGYSAKSSPEYKDAKDNINAHSIYSSGPDLRLEKNKCPLPGTLWIGPRKNTNKGEDKYKHARLRVSLNPPCAGWQWTKKNARHFQEINFRSDQSIFFSAAV